MAGVSDKPPRPSDPRDPRAQDHRVQREAELAAALRANLKRRKAPPAAAANTDPRDTQEDD
jgi:hypothetical protein